MTPVPILVCLVFLLLLRPWHWPDEGGRELSALLAATLLGVLLLNALSRA